MVRVPKAVRVTEKVANFDKLDPHIIDYEPQTAPIEKLESFPIDPNNSSKSL